MFASRHAGRIAASLVFAVFLWGGNNTGVKYLVQFWPPIFVGSTRFLLAGLLLFAILRWSDWMGGTNPISAPLKRQLWLRGGLTLGSYIIVFNVSLQYTSASHVALYLGASPVWALLWEGRTDQDWRGILKRYLAAALALVGVVALFWPVLRNSHGSLTGEFLGLLASVLWTAYGRQCRVLGAQLSGAEVTAHCMWRAGLLLVPLAIYELLHQGFLWRTDAAVIQAYCIVAGGVVAFALWSNALRHWKTSEVYLFNNLIPLSTMSWAHFCLGEQVTPTFWLAMALIISGVLIAQANWQKFFGMLGLPTE